VRLLQTYPHVMDLKDYQRRVLEELGEYAGNVAQFRGIGAIPNPAEVAFVSRTNQPWKPLSRNPNTPFVCLKVPTGGGKTLIAANAAGLLQGAFPAPYQPVPDPPFSPSWGFRSLLGALWLQFYFLITSKKTRHCQAPGCSTIIANEDPGAHLPGGGSKRKKATYSSKLYCSPRCRVRASNHRKTRLGDGG
jgi:hypothetical protein